MSKTQNTEKVNYYQVADQENKVITETNHKYKPKPTAEYKMKRYTH